MLNGSRAEGNRRLRVESTWASSWNAPGRIHAPRGVRGAEADRSSYAPPVRGRAIPEAPWVRRRRAIGLRGAKTGLPAYVPTMDPIEHDAVFGLTAGESSSVMDADGESQTVMFHASDFADIGAAMADEGIAAIHGQLTLATATFDNERLFLRGSTPGASASLTPMDEAGTPVATLKMASGERMERSDDVVLALSVPASAEPSPGAWAGRPYRILVSTTPGTTALDGVAVSIAFDEWTPKFLRAARAGIFPTLLGHLDGHSDATTEIPVLALREFLGANPPAKLYMAFVVLSADGSRTVFASNVFTANLILH